MPRHRIAIFVDGCWWHSCPQHGRKTPFTGPNAQLWEDKMARTVARDVEATATAVSLGWLVVRVWECEVTAEVRAAVERVLAQSSRTATANGRRTSSNMVDVNTPG